jgi:serine/threonine protein kinase
MSILKIERTTPGIVYGKLSYLSPEQARRQPLDGRVDIYAAGILLWELLTGRQLFPVDTKPYDESGNALERARNPEVAPPSTVSSRVPPELDRIVMRALAAEPADRYQTADELRADLAGFLAETAPMTDTDRLAGFLRPLFAEDAHADRRERERLIAEARSLLSGAIDAEDPAVGSLSKRPNGEPPPTLVAASPRRRGEDPRIGSTLGGRYFVRRLCGEGAMGRVYEAHHVDIGRRVAIKVLHASFHHSADLVERFRREARAASKIGHPNIVDVTDSGTTPDGAFYFVMEYLEGTNLEELIRAVGPLPVERALLVGAQIARALEAAHTAEVIHRDLKPANIMLINRKDDEDFVKVLDFGISKDLDASVGESLTRPNVAIGTPVYMAPEQAAGKLATALTDIYGLGGLLYEMLTGAPPCAGEDAMDVLQRKGREDPRPIGELRPDLPRDVQRLVMLALARAPSERQPSMSVFKDQMLACLTEGADAPEPAKTVGAPRITPRVALRTAPTVAGPRSGARAVLSHNARIALGAMAGLVVVAIGVVLLRPEPIPVATGPVLPHHAGALLGAGTIDPSNPVVGQRLAIVPASPAPPASTTPAAFAEPEPDAPTAPAVHRHSVGPGEPLRTAPATHRTSKTVAATSTTSDRKPHDRDLGRTPGAGDDTGARNAVDVAGILRRGQSAFDRGAYPEAVQRGNQAISAGAELEGRLLVGDVYFRLGRYRDALREYDSALSRDPANAILRRRRDLAQQKANAGQ